MKEQHIEREIVLEIIKSLVESYMDSVRYSQMEVATKIRGEIEYWEEKLKD